MKRFLISSATLFGLGLNKKAPGTWGTLATIPLAVFLVAMGPLFHMASIILLLPMAILACEFYEQSHNKHDAKEIIIDEVLGFLITMTWLPMTWQSFVAGFILFRFLDIVKPFPIGYLDKKIPGGLGVVVDDIAAGIIANVILQQILTHTPWLGTQILVTQ